MTLSMGHLNMNYRASTPWNHPQSGTIIPDRTFLHQEINTTVLALSSPSYVAPPPHDAAGFCESGAHEPHTSRTVDNRLR